MQSKYRSWILGGSALVVFLSLSGRWARTVSADAAYEAEKAKALASPFANDGGPGSVDVSSYPPELQATYKDLFLVKCQRCHTSSRPLNSQFLEPDGPKEGKVAKLAEWKGSNPEIFQDKLVWQPEANMWERYVKRMMSKPGCNIQPAEGKKIWQFLVYDSVKRKTGANTAKWAEHRRKLLADFKAKNPSRYRELYETN